MLKSSIFKFSIWALLLLSASTTASADEEGFRKESLGKESSEEDSLTRYDRRILRYRKHWDVLMPTQSVIQTCGNMGIISLGTTASEASGRRICSSASFRNMIRMK